MRERIWHMHTDGITCETVCGLKNARGCDYHDGVTCRNCRKILKLGPWKKPWVVKRGKPSGPPLKFKSGFTIQLFT